MKSVRSLRFLSLLGFLLLIAPFYQQCTWKKAEEAPVAEVIDTSGIQTPSFKNNNPILVEKQNSINTDSITEIKKEDIPIYKKAYEFVDDSGTLNAYEFVVSSFGLFEGSFSEFIKGVKQNIKENDYGMFIFHLKNFSFLLIILFSISILILSFFNRVKLINRFSIIVLVLLFVTIICLIVLPFFTTYKQFKWGYYAFTLVQIGIYYSSKLQISKAK